MTKFGALTLPGDGDMINFVVHYRFLEGTPEWDVDLKLRDGKPRAFYYVPFSAGSKNCIGQRFALAEMQVTMATLFGRLGFALTGDANLGANYDGTVLFPLNSR
ncbi:hypothetical protein LEN26_017707 [Aphanomyces euteiches]|nr:hypothetical protein LEN26_017707 [Aphanomyces euteiches]